MGHITYDSACTLGRPRSRIAIEDTAIEDTGDHEPDALARGNQRAGARSSTNQCAGARSRRAGARSNTTQHPTLARGRAPTNALARGRAPTTRWREVEPNQRAGARSSTNQRWRKVEHQPTLVRGRTPPNTQRWREVEHQPTRWREVETRWREIEHQNERAGARSSVINTPVRSGAPARVPVNRPAAALMIGATPIDHRGHGAGPPDDMIASPHHRGTLPCCDNRLTAGRHHHARHRPHQRPRPDRGLDLDRLLR